MDDAYRSISGGRRKLILAKFRLICTWQLPMSKCTFPVLNRKKIFSMRTQVEQYQHVLHMSAGAAPQANAAKGIASLYLNMKRFEEGGRPTIRGLLTWIQKIPTA